MRTTRTSAKPLCTHALGGEQAVLETRDVVQQRIRDALRARMKGERSLSQELLAERQLEAALEP